MFYSRIALGPNDTDRTRYWFLPDRFPSLPLPFFFIVGQRSAQRAYTSGLAIPPLMGIQLVAYIPDFLRMGWGANSAGHFRECPYGSGRIPRRPTIFGGKGRIQEYIDWETPFIFVESVRFEGVSDPPPPPPVVWGRDIGFTDIPDVFEGGRLFRTA